MTELIEQINNLKIKKYTSRDPYNGYLVVAPDGRVLEDRLTLQQARSWARQTKDFVVERVKKIPFIQAMAEQEAATKGKYTGFHWRNKYAEWKKVN